MVRPGNGCSFPAEEEIFTQRFGPDAPYERYAGGHLGLIQASYRVRHLVVAYNYLNGRPLTKAEQNAAIGVDAFSILRMANLRMTAVRKETVLYPGSHMSLFTTACRMRINMRPRRSSIGSASMARTTRRSRSGAGVRQRSSATAAVRARCRSHYQPPASG